MKRTILLLCALLVAAPAVARELYWKTLDVNARIEADGRIDIVERHQMVFTGDWNGGERKFNIRRGQELEFLGIDRITSDGVRVPLREGSLAEVDGFERVDSSTVRWRSRLPADPAFSQTVLTYELHYRLAWVLVASEAAGSREYRIDTDFAFADRDGPIEQFHLKIDTDPAWHVVDLQREFSAGPLAPGSGFDVDGRLERIASTPPAYVRVVVPRSFQRAAVITMWLAFIAILLLFVFGEARRGRFDQPPRDPIDEAWLERNVFFSKPEAIGFLWDRKTGTAEVAAILARLAQEGKLETKVVAGSAFKSPGMEMTWKGGPRKGLEPHVETLVDALFFDGDFTSTELLQKHYKTSGFNPVSKILDPLNAFMGRNRAWNEQPRTRLWIPLAVAWFIAAAATLVSGRKEGPTPEMAVAMLFGAVFALVFGVIFAGVVRFNVPRIFWPLVGALIVPLIFAVAVTAVSMNQALGPGPWTVVSMTALAVIKFALVISVVRIPESRELIQTRMRLRRARDYFREQLRAPQPQLRDEWMPYLIALGLGTQVDKWTKAFVVAAPAGTIHNVSSSGSSSSPSASSWTGGGGAFGGAGASGSWAVAAGGIASGVASPSSSSGGGGSSSSGGGGGGGW